MLGLCVGRLGESDNGFLAVLFMRGASSVENLKIVFSLTLP
jgi:hypothetical protein